MISSADGPATADGPAVADGPATADDPATGGSPAAAIEAALASLGLKFEAPRPGAYLIRLEGQHKLATMTWLIAGAHSLHVEAFFCRQPDENHARFYRFLLERSGRMYGVHFALDPVGDVYLTGRLPLGRITPDEIDRILGCVLLRIPAITPTLGGRLTTATTLTTPAWAPPAAPFRSARPGTARRRCIPRWPCVCSAG